MMGNFVCKRNKRSLNLFLFFLLTLLSLGFQSTLVKAQTISYPAQVTICQHQVGIYFIYTGSPTCAAMMATHRNHDTEWICIPDTDTGLTGNQDVSCSYKRTYSDGHTERLTDDYLFMRTYYTCPYGPPPNRPFVTIDDQYPRNCELNTTDIIAAKNLGNNCELVSKEVASLDWTIFPIP